MKFANKIAIKTPSQSLFDLSHSKIMSFKMGDLVPCFLKEMLPGDYVRILPETLIRFQPLTAPIMGDVNVTIDFYFVENRLLWAGWEDFISIQSSDAVPIIEGLNGCEIGSIADYFGIPTGTLTHNFDVSALPIAAYVMVWDEYYRDQNLQTERWNALTAGNNDTNYEAILKGTPYKRAWGEDYFTRCLPEPQAGSAVVLPFGSFEDVDVDLEPLGSPYGAMILKTAPDGGDPGLSTDSSLVATATTEELKIAGVGTALLDPAGHLKAKTSELEFDEATIVELRRSFRIQEWLEKLERGGKRYNEVLRNFWNVSSRDNRLDRPEFIGRTKARVSVSEVLTTAQTNVNDGGGSQGDLEVPVGNMAGHGISYSAGKEFGYKCDDYGIMIGLINVQPDTIYMQGLDRMWTRTDVYDYPWPEFAHIGEQEVYNKEIYLDQTTEADRDEVFGYIPRFAEWKHAVNTVHGDFRYNLATWHMARNFASEPALNESFIQADPTNRIFAIADIATPANDDDHLLAIVKHHCTVRRSLPKYGIPTL